ncbi:uncharacterized protein LOC144007611 isoform X1 [Festucalex cinctus]
MVPTRVAFSQDCLEVKSPNQPVAFTFICQMQACGGTSFREGNQEEVDQYTDWSSRLRSRLQVAQMFFFSLLLGCLRLWEGPSHPTAAVAQKGPRLCACVEQPHETHQASQEISNMKLAHNS